MLSMESIELFQKIIDCIDAGTHCALVQVLNTDGSTPLKTGAKALVDSTGRITGTIGGGAVEAEAQRQAILACAEHEPRVFDFAMHGNSREDTSPTCGGGMRILIDPTVVRVRPLLAEVVTDVASGQAGVLHTTLLHGQPPEVGYAWHRGDHDHMAPEFVAGQERDLLRDPVAPLPRLIIAGAGHVGQALAAQAVLVGFAVTVLDDRPEFCTRDRFPDAVTLMCGDMAQALHQGTVGSDTYIVIVTQGHQVDAAVLEACIRKPAAYIGMIGSTRKIEVMRTDFLTSGLATEAQFDRIHAPIGLDIGSITASEIGASITAQLIGVRRRGAHA